MRLVCIGMAGTMLTLAFGCGGDQSRRGDAASDSVETATAPVESAAPATTTDKPKAKLFRVARVIDGDTIALGNGRRVRLVQIDSPEVGEECFANEATRVLSGILPVSTKVRLVADPKLDNVDRYDRLLRYVFKGKRNVNLILVQRGAASVWFYEGDKGRYANKLLSAAQRAEAAGRGLWRACPGTRLDPTHAVATAYAEPETPAEPPVQEPLPAAPAQNCHPSYEGACLDPSVSDYDCLGGEGNGPAYTGTVTVVGPDDYDLDRDGDGLGCEDS